MSRRGLKIRRVISGPKEVKAAVMTKRPLPSDEILSALYNELMVKMDLGPEKVVEMNRMSREQKWSLICAQHEMREGASSVYYVEQLVRHAQPALKEKKVKSKLLSQLQPLATVLKELEVDIRTSTSVSWVSEFVGLPNHGHVALMDLVRDLLLHPDPIYRRNTRKYRVLDRNTTTLYLSLLCVRALMSHRSGFNAVLSYEPSLCTLAHCLTSRHHRITTLILKLLTSVLLAPGGQGKVLQAFDYLRTVADEPKRFQMLVLSLADEPVNPIYQAEALRFINTVVHTAPGPSARVFHQYEFVDAGFSVSEIEQTLRGNQDERIVHELREWERNYTDVQQIMDDLVLARGRNQALKEEVSETVAQLREVTIERDNYYGKTAKLKEKCSRQKSKLSTLREEIIELEAQLKQLDQLQEVNKRYHTHTVELKDKIAELMEENMSVKANQEKLRVMLSQVEKMNIDESIIAEVKVAAAPRENGAETSTTKAAPSGEKTGEDDDEEDEEAADGVAVPSNIPAPPPLPPILGELGPGIPVPPPLPGMGTLLKKPYVPNVPLPMLNWVPIRNAEHTVFQDMNDETIVEEVDFSEFEALFQMKRFVAKQSRVEADGDAKIVHLDLFDNKRQRGIVFAKRRIRLEPSYISQFILNTDLDGLLSEHCELLLQIVPQEKERDTLAKNSDRRDEFGEAEEFLYQIARIPHLEQRLSVMFYMGTFDELLCTTQPKVNAVLKASLSIFRSPRLKKAFEVILAFGNYMNSKRRGLAYGFKLESLEKLLDTKTQDRKQTLLNYITHIVETLYPNVLSFYEDLSINEACEVSLETVDGDFETLQQGLKVVEEEQQRDTHNFILFSFYKQAVKKINKLTNAHLKMKDAYREACLMFCESPKTEPSTFFAYFKTFIANWKKAISENHSRKRRKMAPAEALLKKQSQQEVLKDIASQAAELVASRKDSKAVSTEKVASADVSEKRKAAEKMMREAREELSEEPQEELKEEKEEENEVEETVTEPKSLKDRVPWLAGNIKSNLSRGRADRRRRVGVTERPSDLEEEEEGDIIPPPPEFLDQNGYEEASASTQAALPKRDNLTADSSKRSTRNLNKSSARNQHQSNTSSSSKTRPKGVQLDDDYYAQMMDT